MFARKNGRRKYKHFQKTYYRKVDVYLKFKGIPPYLIEIDDKSHFTLMQNDIDNYSLYVAKKLLKRRILIDQTVNMFVSKSNMFKLIRVNLHNNPNPCFVSSKIESIAKLIKEDLESIQLWERKDFYLYLDADDVIFKSAEFCTPILGYNYFTKTVPQPVKDFDLDQLYGDPNVWPNVPIYNCVKDLDPDGICSKRDDDPNVMLQLCNKIWNKNFSLKDVKSETSLDKLDYIIKRESNLNKLKSINSYYKPILLLDDNPFAKDKFIHNGQMFLMPESDGNSNLITDNNEILYYSKSSLRIPKGTWNKKNVLNYVNNNYWKSGGSVREC